MRFWLRERREYGLRIAFNNWLIGFTKRVVGAKRIRLTYW